ncbi:hypothetical protein SRHO_G00095790 [Serrasalmus rhombeus]
MYTFLDQESTATFCTEDLAKKLNIRGRKTEYLLHTVSQEEKVSSYVLTELEATEPWEIINSLNDGPYAVKTGLGWVVNGPVSKCQEKESDDVERQSFLVNRISLSSIEEMLMSCASYALRRTAQDGAVTTSPEAILTVLRNFYVDNLLKSVATEGEAVNLEKELTKLCARGGFHLHKWVSNSRALLHSTPDDERAAEVKDLDLQLDELPIERALGMQWYTSSDSFKFNIQLPDKPCTR